MSEGVEVLEALFFKNSPTSTLLRSTTAQTRLYLR